MNKEKIIMLKNFIIVIAVLGVIIFLIYFGITSIIKSNFNKKMNNNGYIKTVYDKYESIVSGVSKENYNSSDDLYKESKTYTLDLIEKTLNYSKLNFNKDEEKIIDVLYDEKNNIVTSYYQYSKGDNFNLITAKYYLYNSDFECKVELGLKDDKMCKTIEEYSTKVVDQYEQLLKGYKSLIFILK